MDGQFSPAYEAARYGLAGRTLRDLPPSSHEDFFRQTCIDINLDNHVDFQTAMTASTSITSICAHSSRLSISGPLTIFPRARCGMADSLQCCHRPYTIPTRNLVTPLSTIPNFLLGTFGEFGGQVHVAFPELFKADVDSRSLYWISPFMVAIYEEILYPALQSISDALIANLSHSYAESVLQNDELVSKITLMYPSHFGDAFLAAAKGSTVPQLRTPLFVFTVSEPPFPAWPTGQNEANNRVRALHLVKEMFLAETDVCVEISTDIRSRGCCLRFRADSHFSVLKWASPQSNSFHLRGLVNRPQRNRFHSHTSYTTPQLATFSVATERTDLFEPGVFGVATKNLELESAYANAALPKFHPWDLYPERVSAFVTELRHVCNNLNPDILDGRESRADAGVRISVLVDIQSVDKIMRRSPLVHAAPWIAAYESSWWRLVPMCGCIIFADLPASCRRFVWTRIRMFAIVAEMLNQANALKRSTLNTIQLGSAVWILLDRTLSAEVDDQRHATILAQSCRHEYVNQAAEPVYVGDAHGFHFLADVRLHAGRGSRAPALPGDSVLSIQEAETKIPQFYAERDLGAVQRRMEVVYPLSTSHVRIHPLGLPDEVEHDEVNMLLGV
jgi:hypothetical protein